MNKNNFVSGLVLGVGLGMAGGFVLRKNKRRIKARMYYMKIRADIERQLRELKKFDREDYSKIVETVLDTYRDKVAISVAELDLLRIELKSQWKEAKRRFEAKIQDKLDEEEGEDD
jgi:hypothetical protein